MSICLLLSIIEFSPTCEFIFTKTKLNLLSSGKSPALPWVEADYINFNLHIGRFYCGGSVFKFIADISGFGGGIGLLIMGIRYPKKIMNKELIFYCQYEGGLALTPFPYWNGFGLGIYHRLKGIKLGIECKSIFFSRHPDIPDEPPFSFKPLVTFGLYCSFGVICLQGGKR